ncbi:MAG TPA: twin transmembrane helix small protein [Rhodocyclaceae bacterium]
MQTPLFVKWLIVAALAGVLASLGVALFGLVRDKGRSTRMVKALTFRVALSIGLFILLMLGIAVGVIVPHGVGP